MLSQRANKHHCLGSTVLDGKTLYSVKGEVVETFSVSFVATAGSCEDDGSMKQQEYWMK